MGMEEKGLPRTVEPTDHRACRCSAYSDLFVPSARCLLSRSSISTGSGEGTLVAEPSMHNTSAACTEGARTRTPQTVAQNSIISIYK